MMLDKKILSIFKNRQVVITGGTGLIGRQLVDMLLEHDALVRIISLDKISVATEAEHIYGDLTDFNFCKQICQKRNLKDS